MQLPGPPELDAEARAIVEQAGAAVAPDGAHAIDLLRALVESPESTARDLMRLMGIDRAEMHEGVARLDAATATDNQGFLFSTPIDRVVELAAEEAVMLGRSSVSAKHLLLALIGLQPNGTIDFARSVARFHDDPGWVGSSYSVSSLDVVEPSEVSPEQAAMIAEFQERSRRLEALGIDPSGGPGELVAVIAIAQVRRIGDVVVELIALECRTAGATLTWRATADAATPMGFGEADIAVSDDLGTDYVVWPGGGGGSDTAWSGELSILPPPSPHAARLSITVLGFRPFMMSRVPWQPDPPPLTGPWTFEVVLDGRGEARA